jgi:hypothetical protein
MTGDPCDISALMGRKLPRQASDGGKVKFRVFLELTICAYVTEEQTNVLGRLLYELAHYATYQPDCPQLLQCRPRRVQKPTGFFFWCRVVRLNYYV